MARSISDRKSKRKASAKRGTFTPAEAHPAIATQWHPEKNDGKTPGDFSPSTLPATATKQVISHTDSDENDC
jgi:uncharacterized protein YdaU (DUF1376 family)